MRSLLRLAVLGTTCLLLIPTFPALTGGAMLVCQQPSPYLPRAHWATPYLEHLIARGVIEDPTPLTRPFVQADVVRVLEHADTTRLGSAGRRVMHAILAALRRPNSDEKAWARADGEISTSAASQARRDPLRTAGPGHATAAGGQRKAAAWSVHCDAVEIRGDRFELHRSRERRTAARS